MSLRTGRSDDARMFRRAVRHSRLVRTLRIGLPVTVVLTAVAFVAMNVLDPLRALVKLPVDISGLVISGTKITMQAPRLVGYTRDRRPYSLTARAAAQDITKPDLLELQNIEATMETQDRGAVHLVADTGVYDSKSDKVVLRQNIVIKSAAYEGRLSEAFAEVRKGYILSEKPVEIQTKQGTINANRLEVEESGDLIRFGGGVTMLMNPDAAPSETANAADNTPTSAIDRKSANASDRKTANAADRRTGGK